jgi:hypothetical protein
MIATGDNAIGFRTMVGICRARSGHGSRTAGDRALGGSVVVSPNFEGLPLLDRGRLMFPLRERGASYDFLCYTPQEYRELASWLTLVKEASERGIHIL